MELTLVIGAITVIGIIVSLIVKPNICIKGKSFGLYWIIALLGATIIVVTRCIPFDEAVSGLVRDSEVNPLKLLAIFFGMTALSVFLDEMNFFEFLASFAVKHSKSTQKSLFFMIYVTVSVLTAFTSNDVVILTFTPFIIHFAKKVNINPIPFLISEFVAANTLSMTLIIGNPTNIYLATSVGIDFLTYLKVMIVPSIATSVGVYFILKVTFRKHLRAPLYVIEDDVKLGDKFLLITGLVHLVGAILVLSVCSYIGVEMWQACVLFVLSLFVITTVYLICTKKDFSIFFRLAKRLPFALVPFVISMFILVLAFDRCGLTEQIAELFAVGDSIYVYGLASFIFANVLNNIPMSVFFSEIIANSALSGAELMGALYASVIGSNIGAYFTPVGALAGIMWLSILKRNGIELSFKRFLKFGTLIAIPSMIIALVSLHLSILFI